MRLLAYYKNRGMTLWDRMVELWQEYGFYKEKVQTMKFDGREGAAKIQSMIQTLRDNPVRKVGAYSVEKIYDYKLGTETDAATGKSEAAVLPKSNMIYYQLAGWRVVPCETFRHRTEDQVLPRGKGKLSGGCGRAA